jgi:hypothetical protein
MADECMTTGLAAHPAAVSWERWCTPEEIATYIGSGDLPAGTTEAKKLILACAEHQLKTDEGEPDYDAMTMTHDAVCSAPPVCDCSVSATVMPVGE